MNAVEHKSNIFRSFALVSFETMIRLHKLQIHFIKTIFFRNRICPMSDTSCTKLNIQSTNILTYVCPFFYRSAGAGVPGSTLVSVVGGTPHMVHMPPSVNSPHAHPFPHGVSPTQTPIAVVNPMPAHSSVQMPSQGKL